MPFEYLKPGVYVEESLLFDDASTTTAASVALFVGPAGTGPTTGPVRCATWSDYVINFGGFDPITNNASAKATSYLPYAVYSYFQNGGRPAYVQRVVGTGNAGTAASLDVTDGEVSPTDVFSVSARSVGTVGNNLSIALTLVEGTLDVFNLTVFKDGVSTERFQYLSMDGSVEGTKAIDAVVNDPFSGSTLISITVADDTLIPEAISATPLAGGANPAFPASGDYPAAAVNAVDQITSPVIVNLVGYTTNTNDPDAYTVPDSVNSDDFPNRGDVFIVSDGTPSRISGVSASSYKTQVKGDLNVNTGDSYIAAYAPWIIIPDPRSAGNTITVPPGGAVAGVMSRIDSTVGAFRAPAGVVALINNAVGVDTRFTDSDLAELNTANINVIRPLQGVGVAIMGARTRKAYGADRYVSGRRTLIYIKESLKRSTQYALFENNDQRLWTRLISTAERLLRPLWEAGGLRGNNANEAYFIRCDDTINTPATIAAGEVRMEIGVALEYPAEFIIIRVTQYESGGFTAEVQPRG